MRKIVICPKCGFVGSVDPADGVKPCCPACDTAMRDTGIDREVWAQKTSAEQEAVKAAIVPAKQPAPKPAEVPAAVNAPAQKADALERIAADIHSLKKWFKVWTFIFLALFLLIFFVALTY